MADSDNNTTLPSVTLARESWMTSMTCSADFQPNHTTPRADPAVALSLAWTDAHAAMAAQCLKQQRLETELLERRSSSANVDEGPASRGGRRDDVRRAYAQARAAEALAGAHEQELLERLAVTPANSLAGVAAKLSVIVIEAEDNTDLTDFPVSHVRSALEDLQRLIDGAAAASCPVLEGAAKTSADPAYAMRDVK